MPDKILINACARIVHDHGRVEVLQSLGILGAMSETAAHEVHALSSGIRDDLYIVEQSRAVTLAGCRAKASVIRVIRHEGIAFSLADDLLLIASDSSPSVDGDTISELA